jgi:tRNA pseudouridine38-40 synthase
MIDGITPKQRYCLHIAYIGTRFVGWQRQREKIPSDLITVQETVEETLTFVLKMPQRVNVTSASRTDAGTHALYVSFHLFKLDLFSKLGIL